MSDVQLICGDCLDVLPTLADGSVQCVVTSPPYFGLRDYGHADQIGLESTPAEYVAKMVRVFAEVRRVLRDDGTVWINIGDSYGAGKRTTNKAQSFGNSDQDIPMNSRAQGFSKSLLLVPQRLAIALQDDGWIVRSIIIWAKGISGNVRMGSCMPESVTDRPATSHEYVLMLAKQERYYYDAEAVQEDSVGYNDPQYDAPYTGESTKAFDDAGVQNASEVKRRIVEKRLRKNAGTTHGGNGGGFQNHSGYNQLTNPYVATRRSVWQVNPQPSSIPHFAMMPEKLAEPMILAGCPVGGVVLDPFCGAGTTGVVAVKNGRGFVGIELSEKYTAIAQRRIADAAAQTHLFREGMNR